MTAGHRSRNSGAWWSKSISCRSVVVIGRSLLVDGDRPFRTPAYRRQQHVDGNLIGARAHDRAVLEIEELEGLGRDPEAERVATAPGRIDRHLHGTSFSNTSST